MARTTIIHGSPDNEVMAMIGSQGTYYRGKWQDVRITTVGEDEDTPLDVRTSLVGLIIPTIFSKEQLKSQGVNFEIPDNSRLSYASDVIDILRHRDKTGEADQLERIAHNPLDMYVFEEGTYKIV